MRTGGACGRDRMVGPFQAVLDGHIARGEIDDPTRNEERRYPARPFLGENKRGFGDAFDAADAGTNHDAGRDLVVVVRGFPTGVLDRLARRAHRVDDEFVYAPLFLRLHPLIGIVRAIRTVAARNLAGDLRRKFLDLELLDSAGAALTREEALPGVFDA